MANVMRIKRVSLGWSQRKLAESVGVTGATVSAWETGISWPGPSLIPKLAAVFNMKPESFARELEKARRGLQPA